MLQRIQTVYLLLAIALIALSMTLPLAFYSNIIQGQQFNYTVLGFLQPQDDFAKGFNSLPLFIFAAISILLSLVTVFSFKKRKFQLSLSTFNIVAVLFYIGILAYYFSNVITAGNAGNNVSVSLKYPLTFPAIALIFILLAMRSIKKDENLVKSLDRLR